MTPRAGAPEQIRALATVTLDAQALDELGPQTLDRLADLVAQRLAERRAAGEAPLLTTNDVAEIAGVHAQTVRRAIQTGALQVVGYVGQRPRMRREDVEAWIASNEPPDAAAIPAGQPRPVRRRAGRQSYPRPLGDVIRTLGVGAER
ncbi:helix-turn-helix domain-containing protein [Solirubrobacter sp. CPCC 204708]|uniref:Helix-turn-helix domain-containing protein n=1 Tax=Solirubrobacter deserti TaxID=2282478 RepID=A0ABT4RD24_9ACTN|nr:helix-turn-helix domain-containing protein [Solirubrobacter deserti]MBE2317806.1 helix-turn-helix domain-containing protein [Solirubrobacter deserti]MDA0136417.1 helix-turn-helix domain-containing protein [Solirubrobacter deserti]